MPSRAYSLHGLNMASVIAYFQRFASDFYKASLYAMRGGMWSGRASRRTQVNLTLQFSKASAGIGTTAEHPPRKPEPRSNQSHHPRFDNSYCQAATEDYPCAEHQSLRLGLHICHAPIAIVELHGLSLITVLWIIKQITIIAFSKTGVSP